MSGTPSIFQKVCPSCAENVAVDLERCACGHEFELAGRGAALSTEEAALRDEELYEGYLAARATQAEEAAKAADDALAEEPDNAERRAAAELAREVAKSLRADLDEQRAKINTLRSQLPIKVAKRPAAPPIPAVPVAKPAAAQPKPVNGKKSVRPSTPISPAKPVIAPPPKPLVASPPASEAVKPAEVVSPAAPALVAPSAPNPPPAAGLALSAATKAAAALAAIKQAKAQEQVRPPEPAPAAVVVAPIVSTAPPPTFRAEQAARAARALETMPVQHDGKDCPNCTARVPVATSRCRCGYAFVGDSNELPSLTLCTGDFTALRNTVLRDLSRR